MADTHTVPHSSHTALAHHFDNMEQQREAGTLGMWAFLITEIMFFGGLFLVYILYRSYYPKEFAAGSHELDVLLGGINTAVLICSSLTMALAVYFAQLGSRRLQVVFLVLTMILGAGFLGIKAVEYKAKFEHHLFPGQGFKWGHDEGGLEQKGGQYSSGKRAESVGTTGTAGQRGPASAEAQPRAEQSPANEPNVPARPSSQETPGEGLQTDKVQLFFWIYFAMTGLHALHMIIGLGIMAVLVFMAQRGRFTPEYHAPVEISGLYWHFVDIVWIFLFPLLYLIGRH
ncbi:MAG TPA: cytochrome c oxidase subunit 3 family protein [Blastocatellia bacterium]|nr:cytochrome c oxidase subunit 3 family protein [Blastocatellia bacterium]